ncbi:glycosyltransferase [Microbacterium sp. CFBP9034]|uniref:glycosyltransferase n=1 Tax=Microbacterium sp. CFBP9034 TaxID=3096540 RepID=UPI002A6A6BD5|nr:glycosyltransferase [Microbacterium sp. CFBP9034]MDY0908257.1 glycosyltransferase [Microbacterium sp. CFBP9034]
MHVVMFGDQHVETLGGAQVSMRLQRRFLERAGHTVTVVAPAVHGQRGRSIAPDAAYLDIPSMPITPDREYSLAWPGRRTDRWVDAALAARPPVEVVHVQADFWGAFIGHRYAARHGLPVVHTMHNRVDVGIEATAPFPKTVLRVLNAWQRRALKAPAPSRTAGSDGWAFLRRFAGAADAVTTPSAHFARRLELHGVVPGGRRGVPRPHYGDSRVDVIWNGIDDDILATALADAPAARAPGRPRFVWLGRMSPEKRLLPFLEAIAEASVDADVEIIGGGGQLRAARRIVEKHGLGASPGAGPRVRFAGRLSYAETLRRIAAADAVVQTSIGFETQGMTIFEAASLGTPSVISDPDLAAELGSGFWPVGDGQRADASTGALAAALRAAAADIAAGAPRVPDPGIRDRFRQSSRTAAMLEVYARVTGP